MPRSFFDSRIIFKTRLTNKYINNYYCSVHTFDNMKSQRGVDYLLNRCIVWKLKYQINLRDYVCGKGETIDSAIKDQF